MMIAMVTVAFLAGFLVVAGLNMLVADLVEDRRRKIRARLAEDGRLRQMERARTSMVNREAFEIAAASFAIEQVTIWEKFRHFVSQSGVNAPPERIVLLAAGLAGTGGVLLFALTRSLAFALFVAVLLSVIPFLVVAFNRSRRRKKLRSQLPDAYDMMGRVIRAGQTISQAMRGVADEYSSPIAEEFAYCWEQQNLGLSPEASLRELAKRTGILEIQIFVVALMIHRQTGGNLSQLLGKLSTVIRERERMNTKIQALTAEGQMQALVLGGLPFFVGGAITVLNPGYMAPLLQYPIVFVIAGSLLVGGFVWMQKIIRFDY